MRGIERGYQLGPEVSVAEEAPRLPSDLGEATELFNGSEFVRDTLGDRLCDWYVANKRGEWDAYRATVTDFDRDRYLRWL
jgi:glutamine synthetase